MLPDPEISWFHEMSWCWPRDVVVDAGGVEGAEGVEGLEGVEGVEGVRAPECSSGGAIRAARLRAGTPPWDGRPGPVGAPRRPVRRTRDSAASPVPAR